MLLQTSRACPSVSVKNAFIDLLHKVLLHPVVRPERWVTQGQRQGELGRHLLRSAQLWISLCLCFPMHNYHLVSAMAHGLITSGGINRGRG